MDKRLDDLLSPISQPDTFTNDNRTLHNWSQQCFLFNYLLMWGLPPNFLISEKLTFSFSDPILLVVAPTYLKHPDFAESDFLDHLIILALQELFDGHQLTGLFVATLEHHPIAALPHQTQVLILLHRT